MSRTIRKSPPVHIPRWQRNAYWLLGGVAVLSACVAIRQIGGAAPASAKPPVLGPVQQATATKPAPRAGVDEDKNKYVAVVNGERIPRDELATECLRHYGEQVLESMVNKQLIVEECQRQKLTISQKEVDEEIDNLARKFALPKDQYLKMLERERQIKPAQYAEQVWITLALRKLAGAQLKVSRQELDEAFETGFGPSVKARLIAIRDPQKARKIHAQATAHPDQFGALARQHSEDVASASLNGLIQPIRMHAGDPNLEQAAFGLKVGEISPIVKVGDQHVFLRCEGHLDGAQVDRVKYDALLTELIRERKLRAAGADLFRKIQSKAVVENVFNDAVKRKALPGVAAVINGRQITVHELADQCASRHGIEVLEGTVNRRLLEQAIRRKSLAISQADLDAEIARAAAATGKTTRSGKPDVEGFIGEVTKEQNISREIYLHDSVWPSVALKKLAESEDKPTVTEEDIKRGIEANYGRRARCRAIVLPNQRKAQEVWDKARRAKDAEEFGDLAEKYSVETASKYNRGEVPPIQRYGGQPLLEKAAFELQPGEISGIIQAGDSFVILYCEGYTEPVKVKPEEVRQLVHDDLLEKKSRTAMAKCFEKLQATASIDNYLSGTVKRPKKTEPQIASPPAKPGSPVRK